jgi:nucleoside-diphosphate-sugar epimerase
MPKILITGANSFIGTKFREYSKYKDINEVSLIECTPENIDFTGKDVVLHLAAIVHSSNKTLLSEYLKINRDLCLEVAKKAKDNGIAQFVYLSSSSVYGNQAGRTFFNEDSDCIPEDSYGKSKYEAELLLNQLNDPSFTVSIVRTPIVYGEGVKANMLSIMKLIDAFPVLPFKAIDNKRSITYVENLVRMIDCIIEKKMSGTFIATDRKPLSTTELVTFISKHLGKNILLFKLPEFAVRAAASILPRQINSLFGTIVLDNSKTREKLGFNPPVSSEDGIKRMVLYYKSMKNTRN